jgi:hypothetical protein
MKWLALAIAAGSAVWLSAGAEAQTIGIGTTSGGANAQVGAAIAGVVSSHAGLEMRPQKMGGTQRYMSKTRGNADEIRPRRPRCQGFGYQHDRRPERQAYPNRLFKFATLPDLLGSFSRDREPDL